LKNEIETIRKHINNVFAEDELDRENSTQKMRVERLSKVIQQLCQIKFPQLV